VGLSPIAIAGDNRCFGIVAEPGKPVTLSPRTLFGHSVQTTVLSGTTTKRSAAGRPECDKGRSRFAIGCAQVLDDRLFIDAPVESYWLVSGAVSSAFAAGPELRPVIAGLTPATSAELSVRIFLRDGTELAATPRVVTGDLRPHVVINEIFADALGPEPAQEWLELYNDGGQAVELSDFGLIDGGSVEPGWLPNHVLEPDAFALVARDDFDAAGSWDVAPARNSVVLRVPELGSRGLSNTGEPLALVSRTGLTLSRVPPLAAKSGTSWARVQPSCADVPECFRLHADPGASPGRANVVVE
jgi:hypothetical protein